MSRHFGVHLSIFKPRPWSCSTLLIRSVFISYVPYWLRISDRLCKLEKYVFLQLQCLHFSLAWSDTACIGIACACCEHARFRTVNRVTKVCLSSSLSIAALAALSCWKLCTCTRVLLHILLFYVWMWHTDCSTCVPRRQLLQLWHGVKGESLHPIFTPLCCRASWWCTLWVLITHECSVCLPPKYKNACFYSYVTSR